VTVLADGTPEDFSWDASLGPVASIRLLEVVEVQEPILMVTELK